MKVETSAGGLVHKKGLWLLIQHSGYKHWGFPKGHIGDTQKGESMEDAAVREVEEEGGVKAKIITKIPDKIEYFFRLKGQLIKKSLYYYLMEYESGDPANHDHEVSEAKFVTKDEAMKLLSFKTDKEALKKALSLLKV